jgi:nitrite reductase/ring-hydroxylating ferredoxin subunit
MFDYLKSKNSWKLQPKDGASRHLNHSSQPLREHWIFNRKGVLTESWYPLFSAKELKSGEVRSITIGSQRIAVFRTELGVLAAVDAFCVHMGADLGNGSVCGENLRCYFHRWEYATSGRLTKVPCSKDKTPHAQLTGYPVQEKYGYIWVYSAPETKLPVPEPVGIVEAQGSFLAETTLFVHHHALMSSAVDLQHFASVHELNLEFEYNVENAGRGRDVWKVRGKLPRKGLRDRLARLCLGDAIEYHATFFGGNIIALEYGVGAKLFGVGPRLPSVCVLWAATPLENGISRVKIFLLHPPDQSRFKILRRLGRTMLAIFLLGWLKDDDVKAYPHMRFQTGVMVSDDESVLRLAQTIDRQRISKWSYESSVSKNGFSVNNSLGFEKDTSFFREH